MQVEANPRFRTVSGFGILDTQTHPKVLRAQKAHDKQLRAIADRKVRAALSERGAV